MSVVMWNVTPSMRLLGTKASRVHFAIRAQVGGGSTGGATGIALLLGFVVGVAGCLPPVVGGTPSGFIAARPQNAISPMSATNPAAQNHVCIPCVMFGSMKI